MNMIPRSRWPQHLASLAAAPHRGGRPGDLERPVAPARAALAAATGRRPARPRTLVNCNVRQPTAMRVKGAAWLRYTRFMHLRIQIPKPQVGVGLADTAKQAPFRCELPRPGDVWRGDQPESQSESTILMGAASGESRSGATPRHAGQRATRRGYRPGSPACRCSLRLPHGVGVLPERRDALATPARLRGLPERRRRVGIRRVIRAADGFKSCRAAKPGLTKKKSCNKVV